MSVGLAAEEVSASPWAGAGLVESVTDLSTAVGDGAWLDITLAGVGTVADVAAAVSDPLGELLSAGLGWLMEHLDPLQGWLDDLTGDPAAVGAFGSTWQNVGQALTAAGHELDRIVTVDLEDMTGDAVAAYRLRAAEMAEVCRGLGQGASTIVTGLGLAATVVQVVHDVVRDALADVVGAAISWAAELVCSVGLATPLVIEQVTTRVASLATHVGVKITATLTSAHALRDLLTQLTTAMGALSHGLHAAIAPGPADSLRRAADDVTDTATHTGDELAAPIVAAPSRRPDTRTHAQPGDLPTGRRVTEPSRPPDPNATPRGRPELPSANASADNVRSLLRQDESARTLAQHGYDIERGPATPGPKNPDYRIEGKIFDNYAPTADKARNIWDGVRRKITDEQTERVVLNLDDSAVSLNALREQFRYPIDGLLEVIVVKGGDVIPLFP